MPHVFIFPTCPIHYSSGFYWQGKYASGNPLQISNIPTPPARLAPGHLGGYGCKTLYFPAANTLPDLGVRRSFPPVSQQSYEKSDQFYAFHARKAERCWETAWDQLEPLNTHLPSPSSAPLFSSRCGPPRISPDVQPAAASSRHLEPPTRRTLQCNTGPRVQFAPLNPPRS